MTTDLDAERRPARRTGLRLLRVALDAARPRQWLKNVLARKVLVYHNITPDFLLEGDLRTISRLGRDQLQEIRPLFEASIGDSEENAKELEALGYRVFVAADGNAALRIIDGGAEVRIDLLFTDVVLPNGLSGSALADVVGARRPALPVLFASGYTRSAVLRDGKHVAESQLLQKPYSIASLALRCRQAIDGGVAGQQAKAGPRS